MSLLPTLTKPTTGKLAAFYTEKSGIACRTTDLQALIAKHGEDTVRRVMEWEDADYMPAPSRWVAMFPSRLEKAQADLAFWGYDVVCEAGKQVHTLLNKHMAVSVPEAYVQHCIDKYSEWLTRCAEAQVLDLFPGKSQWTVMWFASITSSYANVQAWRPNHAAFKRFVQSSLVGFYGYTPECYSKLIAEYL
jgi:hypothetical protein